MFFNTTPFILILFPYLLRLLYLLFLSIIDVDLIYIVLSDCTAVITRLLRFIVCNSFTSFYTVFPICIWVCVDSFLYSLLLHLFLTLLNLILRYISIQFLYFLISFLHILFHLHLFLLLAWFLVLSHTKRLLFSYTFSSHLVLFLSCILLTFLPFIISVSSYFISMMRTVMRSGCEGIKK